MWQRALRAKIAIDIAGRAGRGGGDARLGWNATRETPPTRGQRLVEREAERTRGGAGRHRDAHVRELRADVAHRGKRLCALTEAASAAPRPPSTKRARRAAGDAARAAPLSAR